MKLINDTCPDFGCFGEATYQCEVCEFTWIHNKTEMVDYEFHLTGCCGKPCRGTFVHRAIREKYGVCDCEKPLST